MKSCDAINTRCQCHRVSKFMCDFQSKIYIMQCNYSAIWSTHVVKVHLVSKYERDKQSQIYIMQCNQCMKQSAHDVQVHKISKFVSEL